MPLSKENRPLKINTTLALDCYGIPMQINAVFHNRKKSEFKAFVEERMKLVQRARD
jgi:hypothetical protein